MTFKDALHVVSVDVVWKLLIPSWAMGLTARLRRVHLAFDELEVSIVNSSLPFSSHLNGLKYYRNI
jgi:hypothetical protein